MVNVDQHHNWTIQTQKKRDNVRLTVTLLCGYVTIAEVEKQ
jgi:hypothetical protein